MFRTSLQYAPAPYAKTEELIALAQRSREYGGIYATHMRNEGDRHHGLRSKKPRASPAKHTSPLKFGI